MWGRHGIDGMQKRDRKEGRGSGKGGKEEACYICPGISAQGDEALYPMRASSAREIVTLFSARGDAELYPAISDRGRCNSLPSQTEGDMGQLLNF